MSSAAFYFPPNYQHAPAGSNDSLGPNAVAPVSSSANSVLTGTGNPPDSLGNDGDVYFELSSDGTAVTFWDAKQAGHWPMNGISLGGAAAIGGNGPPSDAAVGPLGQLYLDRLNAVIYQAQAS